MVHSFGSQPTIVRYVQTFLGYIDGTTINRCTPEQAQSYDEITWEPFNFVRFGPAPAVTLSEGPLQY